MMQGPALHKTPGAAVATYVTCALAITILTVTMTSSAIAYQPPPFPEEPLSSKQWYLYWKEEQTTPKDGAGVFVAVIDTGIDSTHPELEDAYDADTSRSFIGERCSTDPSCTDPGHDPLGHGTAVAGVIAAAVDGHGIAGAAPGVNLISLKAGDASGYFSADAVSQAIRYGTDADIDLLVMSFSVDPWFRYCDSAPDDSQEERAQQLADRTQIESALQYAADNDVIMVAAAGNQGYDLDSHVDDIYSKARMESGPRTIGGDCATLPAQSEHVITVGSLNASGVRAEYSNIGTDIDIVAPGGDMLWYDQDGTIRGSDSAILTTVPAELLQNSGALADDGSPLVSGIEHDCSTGIDSCRYYWYESGTSYAAPQVAAAAAILLAHGTPPPLIQPALESLALPIPCPASDSDPGCVPTSPGENTWYGTGALQLPMKWPPTGYRGHHDNGPSSS